MPQFNIAYMGGRQPSTPEEGAAQRQKWGQWLGELGDAVINPGTPLMHSRTVSKSGVTETDPTARITGYTIVEAADLDAALEMAKSCPFLEMGDLEVAQMMSMPNAAKSG